MSDPNKSRTMWWRRASVAAVAAGAVLCGACDPEAGTSPAHGPKPKATAGAQAPKPQQPKANCYTGAEFSPPDGYPAADGMLNKEGRTPKYGQPLLEATDQAIFGSYKKNPKAAYRRSKFKLVKICAGSNFSGTYASMREAAGKVNDDRTENAVACSIWALNREVMPKLNDTAIPQHYQEEATGNPGSLGLTSDECKATVAAALSGNGQNNSGHDLVIALPLNGKWEFTLPN